ncbi:hypothetical protein ACFL3S_09465 [Gemmatimonadota bacterium]
MERPAHGFRHHAIGMTLSLAGCMLHGACAPDQDGTASVAVPPGTPIEIDETPYLSVGVVEGDSIQEFHRVVTPFLLPDGSLAIPVAGAHTIRVFDPDGRILSSLGRRGEGPGEFAFLGAAWPRGDTIEVFDGRLLRITRFLPDGSHQVVPLDPVPSAQSAVPGGLPDGWAVMGVADAGMGRRDSLVVHRFGRTGAHLGEVAQTEGMARYSIGTASGPDPLSPKALFAVRRGEIYVAETLTPAIRVLDSMGALRREITWEPDEALSPDAAFRLVVDSAVARVEPDRAAATRQYLEAFPVQDRLSSFWDFIVDEEGFVWVRPFEPLRHTLALGGFERAGPGGRWLIYSSQGVEVGSVEVPSELEPAFITSEAMVGIRRDAMGVESVRVHAVKRR